MTDTSAPATAEKVRRERSPSFPYIGLGKSVERARELFEKAKRYDVLVSDAAKTWGLAPKSSSTLMTVAALASFGLLEDAGGTLDKRKVRISDSCARILGDARPGVREKLLAEAAVKPKLIAEYAARWGKSRPDEHFVLSELKFEKGFNDEGATRFVRVYDETIRYAPESAFDTIADNEAEADGTPEGSDRRLGGAHVGDLVQWTSAGVDQFRAPVKVEQISEDGAWLWVEGSTTGIPMEQVEVIRKGEGGAPLMPPPRPPMTTDTGRGLAGEQELLRGPLSREVSYRLLVSGDLGPREIGKLIKLLQAQQAILADDEDEVSA